jgi:hypothetical protein
VLCRSWQWWARQQSWPNGTASTVTSALCQISLQDPVVRPTPRTYRDNLAIEYDVISRQPGDHIHELPKALGPVIASTGEEPWTRVSEMSLDPIAVIFDLVDPLRAFGRDVAQRCKASSMKPGKVAACAPFGTRASDRASEVDVFERVVK